MFNYSQRLIYVEVVRVSITVRSLGSFEAEAKYARVSRLGDRLEELSTVINWEAFRPTLERFRAPNEGAGRPETDCLLLFKMLVLQAWYGLSDEQLEYQVADRFSFQKFLGFPETVPDYTTVWHFRETITKARVEQELLDKLNKQLDAKGLKVKKGVIQDATIITADPGKKRIAELKNNADKGKGVDYAPNQLAHMDLDASSTEKNGQYEFGYKAHVKCDADHQIIRSVEVTTASVHDSQVQLEKKGDKAMWRDRAYHGKPLRCNGVKDFTSIKATRGHPITEAERKRNTTFSKVRCLGERPFAVIKRVFHGGHVYVKTIGKVATQIVMRCFAYNIYRAFGISLAQA